jgi:hypothetical protein
MANKTENTEKYIVVSGGYGAFKQGDVLTVDQLYGGPEDLPALLRLGALRTLSLAEQAFMAEQAALAEAEQAAEEPAPAYVEPKLPAHEISTTAMRTGVQPEIVPNVPVLEKQ